MSDHPHDPSSLPTAQHHDARAATALDTGDTHEHTGGAHQDSDNSAGHGHDGAHGHGHGGHADHVAVFRRLFWRNLLLAVPTVTASGMFASILGYQLPDVAGLSWVSPVLGTVIYVWGGRPFLTGAVEEIRARAPGMMLLVALAITVAFTSSWASTQAECQRGACHSQSSSG